MSNPTPSFWPWPQTQERGGGMVIPAEYFIEMPTHLELTALEILDGYLSQSKHCKDLADIKVCSIRFITH